VTVRRSFIIAAYSLMCLGSPFAQPAQGARTIIEAVRHVETGGEADPAAATGDGGKSIGPMQISRACWIDSRVPGRWEDCRDARYAERVFEAYCERYGATTPEQQARLWNAGPRWRAKMRATDGYWRKVRAAMEEDQ
jgi:hypothetical protein